MSTRKPPLPPYIDISDFRFMPLVIERLKRSKQWLIAKRRPEIGFYCVNLWTRAWHELPAGSIEDDDDVLADAAMCSPENWPAVKDDVMRGWVRCDDGRLYHPIVCENAAEAWNEKTRHRWKKECDRVRKANSLARAKGEEEQPLPSAPPEISADFENGFRAPSAEIQTTSRGIPAENALKGQGQGQGQGQGYSFSETSNEVSSNELSASAGTPSEEKRARRERAPGVTAELDGYRAEFDGHFWPAWPHKVGKPDALKAWLRARRNGIPAADILAGVSRYVASKPADRSWLNPATFLNQHRWADAPAPVAQARAGPLPSADKGGFITARRMLRERIHAETAHHNGSFSGDFTRHAAIELIAPDRRVGGADRTQSDDGRMELDLSPVPTV